jgi:glucan-binding YG repeat protein
MLAQNIERGKVSMANLQNIMDKTIERVQSQEFNIDRKVRDTKELNANDTFDYYVNNTKVGTVESLEDKNGVGMVIAYLDTESGSKQLFTISKSDENDFYLTDKGEKMSREQATTRAEKSVINAINTVRVMDAFKSETFAYADSYERNRQQEREMETPVVPEIEHEQQKEYGGIEL